MHTHTKKRSQTVWIEFLYYLDIWDAFSFENIQLKVNWSSFPSGDGLHDVKCSEVGVD